MRVRLRVRVRIRLTRGKAWRAAVGDEGMSRPIWLGLGLGLGIRD